MLPQPQQSEWNPEYQRHLVKQWDPEERSFYWQHYVKGSGWVLFKWLPLELGRDRIDSGPGNTYHNSNPTQNTAFSSEGQSSAGASAFSQPDNASSSRAEAAIVGTYSTENTQHWEKLDPAYSVKPSSFFAEGIVFSILFTEPAGNTTKAYNSSISTVKYGQFVHSQIRRFVVVRIKKGFCYACPIFTYGNQATTKPGVKADEHAIAYSEGFLPALVNGETTLSKQPICVRMNAVEQPLSTPSRICFGIHHPIQHNVKVKHLGQDIYTDMARLRGYWKMEDAGDVPNNNPAEATAEATESPTLSYYPPSNPGLYSSSTTHYDYHAQSNPYGYHPQHNPYGYHPQHSPYAYHPSANQYGYHYHYNTRGYHPSTNPRGYHPVYNTQGI